MAIVPSVLVIGNRMEAKRLLLVGVIEIGGQVFFNQWVDATSIRWEFRDYGRNT